MMATVFGALPIAPARGMVGGMGKRPSVMMEVRIAPPVHNSSFSLTIRSLRNQCHSSRCSALPFGPQALALTSVSYTSAAAYCPNPGIPLGTRKVGSQYRLEDRVTYYCNRGLTLRGSEQRTCLEGGSWSGTEPSCQGDPYLYPQVRPCSPIRTSPQERTAFSCCHHPAPSSLL